nr:hypothetical protein Iba_chr04cCG2930 [Ipomoea batatas]
MNKISMSLSSSNLAVLNTITGEKQKRLTNFPRKMDAAVLSANPLRLSIPPAGKFARPFRAVPPKKIKDDDSQKTQHQEAANWIGAGRHLQWTAGWNGAVGGLESQLFSLESQLLQARDNGFKSFQHLVDFSLLFVGVGMGTLFLTFKLVSFNDDFLYPPSCSLCLFDEPSLLAMSPAFRFYNCNSYPIVLE